MHSCARKWAVGNIWEAIRVNARVEELTGRPFHALDLNKIVAMQTDKLKRATDEVAFLDKYQHLTDAQRIAARDEWRQRKQQRIQELAVDLTRAEHSWSEERRRLDMQVLKSKSEVLERSQAVGVGGHVSCHYGDRRHVITHSHPAHAPTSSPTYFDSVRTSNESTSVTAPLPPKSNNTAPLNAHSKPKRSSSMC